MILIPILLIVMAIIVYDLKRAKVRVPATIGGGSSPVGVVLALGRFEGRQLLQHPAFLAGVGLVVTAAVLVASGNDGENLTHDVSGPGLLMFPLAGMTIIACSMMTLRARRDGTEELFSSLPVSEDARAGGHLLSAAWAVAGAAVLTGATLAVLYATGSFGQPSIAELLVGPVLVGCAAAVGVTAARLVPSAAIGFLAVVAMGVFQGSIDHFSGVGTTRTSWFAPLVPPPESIPAGIWPRRPWSHLVYIIGLGAFAAALGFVVRRWNRRTTRALGAALALIAVGGLAQSRPFPESVSKRAAAYIEHPALVCRTLDNVEYCAYADQAARIDRWVPAVNNVIAVVPASVRERGLRVVQRVSPTEIFPMPEPVLRRLSAAVPARSPKAWQPDGAIHPNMDWCGSGSSCSLALATQTGVWAVGLPLDPQSISLPEPYGDLQIAGYDSGGQARAVVALWLGARSSPAARALFRRAVTQPPDPHEGDPAGGRQRFFVQGCGGINEPGTMFAPADALLTNQLLSLPDRLVAGLVNAHWNRLTDPATGIDAVLGLFDVRLPTPAQTAISFSLC